MNIVLIFSWFVRTINRRMTSIRNPQNVCTICLDKFENKKLGFLENCRHIFCIDCIKEWYKYNTNCPLCRMDFKDIIEIVSSPEIEFESVPRNQNQSTIDSTSPTHYYIDCNIEITFIQLQGIVGSIADSSFQEVEVLQASHENSM